MKRPQLYLETSVWNFYFANDAPEKREVTLKTLGEFKENGIDQCNKYESRIF